MWMAGGRGSGGKEGVMSGGIGRRNARFRLKVREAGTRMLETVTYLDQT